MDKLSARAIPCLFLGFPVGSPDYSFYHPPLHQLLDSRDVRAFGLMSQCPTILGTLVEVSWFPLPPSSSHPLFPLLPLLRYPHPPLVLPSQPLALPRQVTVDSVGGGAGGAAASSTRFGGARLRGAGVRGAGAGGANSGGARAGGSGTGGASSGGAGAKGAGTGGASSRGAGAGGTGIGGASSGGAGAGGTGTGGASSGGAGAGGAGTEETGAGASPTASPTARPHRHNTHFQALRRLERKEQERMEQERQELQQFDHGLQALGLPSSFPIHSQSPTAYGPTFPPSDSTPAVFSPPQSRSSPPVVPHDWTSRCPPRAQPSSPLADLRTVLFRSPPHHSPPVSLLPSPPESSLASSVSALTAAVADFASTHRLDYATHVVAAPPPRPLSNGAAASPSLCAMLLSLEGDPDALDIPTPRTYREAVSRKWASQWKAAMDAELACWRSTGTYVDAVPPPRANIVDGMWLFKVNRPPGSPPVFKARYVARGFRQHEGFDFFQTFAPIPKMTTLRVLLDTFPPRTQWSLRKLVYGLRQSPREWHDTLHSTLRDLGFRPSSTDPSLFVRTGSTLFFILVYVLWRFRFQFSTTQPTPLAVDHRLTGPFPDEPFESSGPYVELVGCLISLDSCCEGGEVPGDYIRHGACAWRDTASCVDHCDSSNDDDVESQRSTQGYCFGLGAGAGAVSWRSTRSSSVATSSAEAEIYASDMAAQELRWLTFLLANLGERPRSAPTLYADNEAMILLCQQPRLESRVKHNYVRYFLLRELQRRGQACLDFVDSEAKIADVFTKAFAPGDHHRFCVQLGLVEAGPRLL
ncbi:unnamed protein product [Closterium sp. NIES-53]